MSDTDDIRKDLAYIRTRVDQIYEKVGNHETRLTVIERDLKKESQDRKSGDQTSKGNNLVLMVAIAAIVVSLLSFLYRIIFP